MQKSWIMRSDFTARMRCEDPRECKYAVCYALDKVKGTQGACSLSFSSVSRRGSRRNFLADGEVTASTLDSLPTGSAVRVIVRGEAESEMRLLTPQEETTLSKALPLDNTVKDGIVKRLTRECFNRKFSAEREWPESLLDYNGCWVENSQVAIRFWVEDDPDLAQTLFATLSP